MHRFESTTGSGPHSPIKERNARRDKIPILTLDALEEVISVLITGHNIKPQNRLGGLSPIQYLTQCYIVHYLNHGFSLLDDLSGTHYRQEVVSVKWIKSENRRPHINFLYLRYTGDCLTANEYLRKKVVIEFDESDIRKLRVLSTDGKRLGTVVAPRTWQQYRHGIRTRLAIIKLTRRKRMLGRDLLSGYFNYLLNKKHLPKVATELIRVSREYGGVTVNIDKEKPASNDVLRVKSSEANSKRLRTKIPAWNPELQYMPANRR
ncbi:Mu transposase C-terminal domain-containing protein [Aliikangiella sp. IMCC44359]|uniref:Mu transposase C-terminal domain-containing protein n=1 Tax=Aliikangiella sp. IMCC44359 TaxID=3459125 RepID=UPI00403B2198